MRISLDFFGEDIVDGNLPKMSLGQCQNLVRREKSLLIKYTHKHLSSLIDHSLVFLFKYYIF